MIDCVSAWYRSFFSDNEHCTVFLFVCLLLGNRDRKCLSQNILIIITKTLFHKGIYLTSVNLPYVPQCEVNKITKYGLKIKI